MRTFNSIGLALLAATAKAYTENEPTTTTHAPVCTATSSTGSGAYFDLRPDIAWPQDAGKAHKNAVHKDYHSRGYDYGKNFTMNVCNPVVDPITDVVGVEESQWQNVSAYYMAHGNIYSIGSESQGLHSRGRKLFVQYTGGSPCGESKSKSSMAQRSDDSAYVYDDIDTGKTMPHEVSELSSDDDDDDDEDNDDDKEDGVRRKSTIISFLCDKDPGNTQTTIAFVGTDPDECSYFFEARSQHACASAEPHKPGEVGPGSVFGLILLIAVLVYFLGGVFYNRTVNHARGWRQLPNYSLWAGMWSFICDILVIATSSCGRMFRGRRGYSSLRSGPSARDNEQEAQRNALIDQLDEEWDD